MDSGDIDRYIGERCAYGVDWREPTLHAPAHTRISRFYPAQIPFKEANKGIVRFMSLATKSLGPPVTHPRFGHWILRGWSSATTAVNWIPRFIKFQLSHNVM